jgi:hypothetical protein
LNGLGKANPNKNYFASLGTGTYVENTNRFFGLDENRRIVLLETSNIVLGSDFVSTTAPLVEGTSGPNKYDKDNYMIFKNFKTHYGTTT